MGWGCLLRPVVTTSNGRLAPSKLCERTTGVVKFDQIMCLSEANVSISQSRLTRSAISWPQLRYWIIELSCAIAQCRLFLLLGADGYRLRNDTDSCIVIATSRA